MNAIGARKRGSLTEKSTHLNFHFNLINDLNLLNIWTYTYGLSIWNGFDNGNLLGKWVDGKWVGDSGNAVIMSGSDGKWDMVEANEYHHVVCIFRI